MREPTPDPNIGLSKIPKWYRKKEYSLSQKGLDMIDRIIKESPQYKNLIAEFLEKLKPYRYVRLLGERKTIGDIIKEYEERLHKE